MTVEKPTCDDADQAGQETRAGQDNGRVSGVLHEALQALHRDLAVLEARLGVQDGSGRGTHGHGKRLWLSARELADLTGFPVHTIRDWCEQELLPAQKTRNRWRLERESAIMALKKMNRRRRRKRHGGKPA